MRRVLPCLLAVLFAANLATAIPYASQIRVSAPEVAQTRDLSISYVLNEPADSVTIEVLDEAQVVVASFDGTKTQGWNMVSWNTRTDNDTGALVDVGEGFTVRITASLDQPEQWYEFAANGKADSGTTQTTVQDWWNPIEVYIPRDPTSEAFGIVHALTARTGADLHAGALAFSADLSLASGGAIGDLYLVPETATSNGAQVWGVSEDPDDPTRLFISSQGAETRLYTAEGPLASTLQDADPGNVIANAIRTVAVGYAGETKRAVFSRSATDFLSWAELGSDNTLTGTFDELLAPVPRVVAGIDVAFDDDGNLYWLVRSGISSGNFGGQILRWSAATLADLDPDNPATLLTFDGELDPTANLSGDNADWNLIASPGDGPGPSDEFEERRFVGMTITPQGDVFALSRRFIYFIGNTETGALRGQLGETARIVDVTTTNHNTFAAGIASDAFGNLYVVDRANAYIRGFAPGGVSEITMAAPASQTFSVVEMPLQTGESWTMYP